ncbi:hypothetical protein Lepto7375DRAFT_3213 [Leptolyngbya sp. PCC 7375]|nr:hypothetical protein Lepto7375DRAFT_3213 [Leptolyngbya sp. PCC 7375]
MSPLVQQIIQRLDRLPDSALRQVLLLVDSLLGSLQNAQDTSSSSSNCISETNDMPNLENHGGIWLVKATKQPTPDYNSVIFQVREERMDNLTQW